MKATDAPSDAADASVFADAALFDSLLALLGPLDDPDDVDLVELPGDLAHEMASQGEVDATAQLLQGVLSLTTEAASTAAGQSGVGSSIGGEKAPSLEPNGAAVARKPQSQRSNHEALLPEQHTRIDAAAERLEQSLSLTSGQTALAMEPQVEATTQLLEDLLSFNGGNTSKTNEHVVSATSPTDTKRPVNAPSTTLKEPTPSIPRVPKRRVTAKDPSNGSGALIHEVPAVSEPETKASSTVDTVPVTLKASKKLEDIPVVPKTTRKQSDGEAQPSESSQSLASDSQDGADSATGIASTRWLRQKAEMALLRAQVQDLEAQLSQIKQDAVIKTEQDEENGTDREMSSVWEKIAKRQSEERQRVEVENIKLKKRLEAQLRVARNLEKLLRKRSLTDPDASTSDSKRVRVSPFQESPALLDEMRSSIQSQIDLVDAEIQAAGLSTTTKETFEMKAKTDETTAAAYAELVLVKVLPFPLQQVDDVVWQCMTASRSATVCDIEAELKLRVRQTDTVMYVKGVGSRRSEATRTRLVVDAVGITEGALFAGEPVRCRKHGYIVIERHPSCCTSSPSTVLKTSVRLLPDSATTETEGQPHHSGRAVELLIAAYTQHTKTLVQLIENTLLEQAVSSH